MKVRNHTPLWRRALRKGGRLLFDVAENNGVWDIDRNGERWLIAHLLSSRAGQVGAEPFVILDIGANGGDYTAAALEEADRLQRTVVVYALEPSARAADGLRARFIGEPRVVVVQAAAGNHRTTAQLYGGELGSSQASLISREVLTGVGAVAVPVIRLDDCLQDRSIGRVDLLKLDVEGFELAALEGLGAKLDPQVVDAIQFEYGGTTLDAGVTLRDLYRLLRDAGYLIAKLFPRAIEVRAYDPGMEHYAYSNYVALSPRWLAGRRHRGGPA